MSPTCGDTCECRLFLADIVCRCNTEEARPRDTHLYHLTNKQISPNPGLWVSTLAFERSSKFDDLSALFSIAQFSATPLKSRFREASFWRCDKAKKGQIDRRICWISSNAIFVWGFFLSRHQSVPKRQDNTKGMTTGSRFRLSVSAGSQKRAIHEPEGRNESRFSSISKK